MDIFLDTEFIGFKSLHPLSVGLCPLNAKLPPAYFELEVDQPDISRLDEEDQFFMTTEVLCQLGISEQLRALELIGVRTLRSNFSELEGAIYKYLKACSEVAACTKEKIWLISDYSGDFDVLRKFVNQEYLNGLGVREITVDKLIPEIWKVQADYTNFQNELFKVGLKIGERLTLKRHHAYFDAWAMRESFKSTVMKNC